MKHDMHRSRAIYEHELRIIAALRDVGGRAVLDAESLVVPHGETVRCALCRRPVPADEAHEHGQGHVGDRCCWTSAMRATEGEP
jgi:hypothetical protein